MVTLAKFKDASGRRRPVSSLAWQKVFIFSNCFLRDHLYHDNIYLNGSSNKQKRVNRAFYLVQIFQSWCSFFRAGANFSEMVLIFYAKFRHFALMLGVLCQFLVLLIISVVNHHNQITIIVLYSYLFLVGLDAREDTKECPLIKVDLLFVHL